MMENIIKLLGYVHSEFKKMTLKNGYNFIFFKLRVPRDSKRNINTYKEDILNCMISEYLEYSPEKNLSPGNLVRIEGSLQTNKTTINDTNIDITYIVISHLSVETNQSLTKKTSNLNQDIKPKTKGVYTKNQPYSTSKPYHDNFPKEYDTRNKITCVCGQTFLDTLEYCPSCGRSTLEIIRNK